MIPVKIERTHPDALIPTRATEGSACFDVYSVEKVIVAPGSVAIVDLGLRVAIPTGYEIVVRPRSGLAFKQGISIANTPGTIDSDYRGPLKVALVNHTNTEVLLEKGSRVAQIKLQEVLDWGFVEEPVDIDTNRGEGGFGSTGK